MNRMPRIFVAVVLSLALLVAVSPVAQARTLAKPQPSPRLNADSWLDAALVWLGSFLTGTPAQTPRSQTKITISLPPGGTGAASPMTGSCIDPNGCTFGGWGGV
jgi:hypothetical protein